MNQPQRCAIVGIAHAHAYHLAEVLKEQPGVEVVAVADFTPGCAASFAERLAIPKAYDDHTALYANEQIDITLCCSENVRHLEVAQVAAEAGVHVMVEKPMAASHEHGRGMLEAARRAGTHLMVNWPTTWDGANHTIARLISEGSLGQVVHMRMRAGHGGPCGAAPDEQRAQAWWYHKELGGGALLDFCCYGCCLSRWFIGEAPTAVTGLADRLVESFGDVEDNATIMVRYPRAACVFEATWTQPAADPGPSMVIYGTKGNLVVASTPAGRRLTISRPGQAEPESVVPDELPAHMSSGPAHFLSVVRGEVQMHPSVSPEMNLEVMGMLTGGAMSAAEGRTVSLPL